MVQKLTKEELGVRLGDLDIELVRQGLQPRLRPLQCFKTLYGNLPNGPERDSLFEPISSWFIERYGNRVVWDGVIGRVPVVIRGGVYLGEIPGITGNACVRLVDHIKDLPRDIADSLTPEEFEALGRRMSGATVAFQHLYNLNIDDTFLDVTERGLIQRGLFDLENAANTLKQSGDTQTVIFQTHAAAEKFLKVALKRSGSKLDLQSLKHNLPKIFEKLVAIENRYDWLRSSVDELQKFAPNSEIRYGVVPRTVEDAIIAFNAAVSICGTLAIIWLFDLARGNSKSAFAPGKFYLDGSESPFYCKKVIDSPKGKLAVLTRFDVNPLLGAIMMDISVELKCSALYIEVTDGCKIEDLRSRFEHQMRNRGKLLRPEDIGIKIDAGAEGSYTTAHVRIRVQPRK